MRRRRLTMSLSPEAAGEADEAQREIAFRLPNGADQEAVSPLLAENEAQALTLLLARCIQRIGAPHRQKRSVSQPFPPWHGPRSRPRWSGWRPRWS